MDDCIASREAAYAIYESTGDARRAGQCAVWLYEHYMKLYTEDCERMGTRSGMGTARRCRMT